MDNATQWLPLVLPLVLLELGLKGVALADLIRRERTRGPKWAWALGILLVNFFGSVVYLALGREE